MAFEQGVFTSTSVTVNGDGIPVGDKAVSAAFLAREKYHLYGNGISLNPTSAFYVSPVSGLTARVGAGWGIMEGYSFRLTADYDITMTSSTSDQTLYIGVRLDVVTGEYTDSNVAARTTFVAATDRVFAIIVIPANAVTLTTAMITDTRYNTTYCGTVDAARVALAALAAEYEDQLEALTESGVPNHASTHLSGGDDPLPFDAICSNLIIGDFRINQRAVSGTVVLTAGAYGHDRWKAGSGGCTYTFSTSANITTVNISSGSLVQVVEGLNLRSGTVCLSWTGTAQGKIGAGSYSASGVIGTATGGTNINIEFNTGTLSKVQLNYGSVALPFVPRSYAEELCLCERYYKKLGFIYLAYFNSTTSVRFFVPLSVEMRTTPTTVITLVDYIRKYDGTTVTAGSLSSPTVIYSWGDKNEIVVSFPVSGATNLASGLLLAYGYLDAEL